MPCSNQMKSKIKIPDSAIRRLSLYHRHLASLQSLGVETISSREIATVYGLAPFQVRKDLSYFGTFGHRGRGYSVIKLREKIGKILGLDRAWPMALVGAGNIGMAVFRYQELRSQGFKIAAVFDSDPRKTGKKLESGVVIKPLDQIPSEVQKLGIELGVLAVPSEAAQAAADSLIAAGVKAILCFPSGQINVPRDVAVKRVNLGVDLETLSYFLANR
jgi:redox-sensing transcriptional repressor